MKVPITITVDKQHLTNAKIEADERKRSLSHVINEMMSPTTVILETDLFDSILEQANEQERSPSFIVNSILRDTL